MSAPVRAQTYDHPLALKAMRANLCPECDQPAEAHLDDNRFWMPRTCSLLPKGVTERIEWQRHLDGQA